MARLHHEVTIAAAPRAWFANFLAELHNAIEAVQFVDGRLVGPIGDEFPVSLLDGEHVRPGAHYRLGDQESPRPLDVMLDAWDRHAGTRFTLAGRTAGNRFVCGVDLRSVDQPATFEVDATVTGLGEQQAQRQPQRPVRCEAIVDFDRWWADAVAGGGRTPGPAPVRVTVSHQLVVAKLAMTVRPAAPGSWRVAVHAVITGRSWTRPIAALGLLVGRRRLLRGYRDAVDTAAKVWNAELPKLISRDLDGPSGESIWEMLTSLELEPSDRQNG